MCLQCRKYGRKFVITSPITPREKQVWEWLFKMMYPQDAHYWFMMWHRWVWFEYKNMA